MADTAGTALRQLSSWETSRDGAELYEIAKQRNLPGRSKMRRDELARKLGRGRITGCRAECRQRRPQAVQILAPQPVGRIWVANHFPDYQLDHERERCLQSLAAARRLESLAAEPPGHVIVAGDIDADEASDSMRFWTGRHVIEDLSICYRSAWESTHPCEPLATYIPENPNQVNADWPFRGIDHVRSAAAPPVDAVDPRPPPGVRPRPRQRQRPLRPRRRTGAAVRTFRIDDAGPGRIRTGLTESRGQGRR